MEYQILREEPTNSGTFVTTGDKVDPSVDMAEHCAALTAEHSARFAIYPYDPAVRVKPARTAKQQQADAKAEEETAAAAEKAAS